MWCGTSQFTQTMESSQEQVSKLINLNSRVDNYRLKTFISATESVMVEEINVKENCKFAELQEHSGFQVLTKVGNYMQSGSLGFMAKCHLDRRKMTWPCKERSDGQALILGR